MGHYVIRKILVVLIILLPAISYSGCKKQEKCGCDGDALFTLTNRPANVYFNETGTNAYCSLVDDPYSTYYFCNPVEMSPKLKSYTSGDVLLISGPVFWECNYVYQSGNSSYRSYYKVYNIQVTDVFLDLYGKK